jgi:leucyl/phenylalanyl-tRNA---protein transferase
MALPPSPTIPVETLLLAYRNGIFPMSETRDDPEVFWVEPRERAVIPLDAFHVSRSLAKTLRSDRYTVTIDQAYASVIRACAAPRPGHPESWISERIIASYEDLQAAGHAHSIECWETGADAQPRLAGGLYGVAFDRVFCGESMFSLSDNASKVALCWLVAMMRHAGFALLDCQFMTAHLASMGAVEFSQREYLERLSQSRGEAQASLATAHAELLDAAAASDHSSPGKLIWQSLIQTS